MKEKIEWRIKRIKKKRYPYYKKKCKQKKKGIEIQKYMNNGDSFIKAALK